MPSQTHSDVLDHGLGSTGEFVLSLPSGEIRITGHDADGVRVREVDGRAISDLFEIHGDATRLTMRLRDDRIHGRHAGPRGEANLEIEVPRSARVTVDAGSADITGAGLIGRQRFKTASGDIQLTAAGGPIEIEAVSGDVRIDADADVELAAKAVSGDVRVRGAALLSAAVTTTSGDIDLDCRLPGPGPYTIQTVSGDASARSGPTLRVDAHTLTGDIGDATTQGLAGSTGRRPRSGEGPTLTFKSVSGDLHLTDTTPASGVTASHGTPERPASQPPGLTGAPDTEPDRLAILRDLEDGRIDVTEAAARLADLDDPDA
jgi:DUF4097 and DUF4098 domain-containing protein YvlB